MKVTPRQILTYAFISHGLYGSSDILFGILPFFLPILKNTTNSLFDKERFSKEVNNAYGWEITTDVVEDLIPRFLKVGWLKEMELSSKETAYEICEIEEQVSKDDQQQILKILDELGEGLVNFVEKLSPLTNIKREKNYLVEMFLTWLTTFEADEKEKILLKAQDLMGEPESKSENRAVNKEQISKQEIYLCARFVQFLEKENLDLFEKVIDINSIILLTEIAFDFKDPPDKSRKVKDLRVFLDAPFFMDAVGLSGTQRFRNAEVILDSLKNLGCELGIFDHSCGEVISNLRGLFKKVGNERFGPTADALRKSEIREDFVKSVFEDVDYYVEKLGLKIFKRDINLFPNEHRFFPNDYIEEFTAHAGWGDDVSIPIGGKNITTEIDAKSVAFIMRMRAGKESKDPFKSKAFLITRNRIFETYSKRFCREHGLLFESNFGPVIHQRKIASLLWLTFGATERRDISRYQLMISCQKVASWQPHLVEKTKRVLKEIDAEKLPILEALLAKERSSQVLHDLTLGAESVVTPATIGELYRKVVESTAEEVKQEKDKEISRIKKGYSAKIAKARKEIVDWKEADKEMLLILIKSINKLENKFFKVFKFSFLAALVIELFGFLNFGMESKIHLFAFVFAIPSVYIVIVEKFDQVPNILSSKFLKFKKDKLAKDLENLGKSHILQDYKINWETEKIYDKKRKTNT